MDRINAVVLAGDSRKGFGREGVENKSLLPINGKPMVEYVIDALRDSSLISRISISGPPDLLKSHLGDKVDFYTEDRSLFETSRQAWNPMADKAVLIVTSDIPMIAGWMITDFVKRCYQQGGFLLPYSE